MEEWACKLADWFKKNLSLDDEQTEVTAYALISLFLIVIPLFFIVLICRFFGVLFEGLLATFTAAFFRSVTGGAHLSSPWRCIFISTILPVLFALVSKFWGPGLPLWRLIFLLLVVTIYGLFVINRYAPAEVKEKPIRPEKTGNYRKLSFIYLVLWLFFSTFLIYKGYQKLLLSTILGFFWQMITLTPAGFYLYRRLSKIYVKEGVK